MALFLIPGKGQPMGDDLRHAIKHVIVPCALRRSQKRVVNEAGERGIPADPTKTRRIILGSTASAST